MTMMEERPATILVKSSSRDARVSCETLSNVETFHKQEVTAADKLHGGMVDVNTVTEGTCHGMEGKSYGGHKGFLSTGQLFACFPPMNVTYILTKPMMSPGRDGRRGADLGGKTRHHPGAAPLSGSTSYSGLAPQSGPMKLNAGSITSNTGSLKGQTLSSKGSFGPFTTIPADVVGKREGPRGYETDEPNSPEVTCIGTVRAKQKTFKANCAITKERDHGGRKGKGVTWVKSFGSSREEKPSKWKHFVRGSVVPMSKVATSLRLSDIDLNRFSLACKVSAATREGIDGESSAQSKEAVDHPENAEEKDNTAEYEPEIPPSNSLLLMRGSRKLESQEPREPPRRLLTRAKSNLESPTSLPKATPEASIWERRAVPQPLSLNVGRPMKLELKNPRTR